MAAIIEFRLSTEEFALEETLDTHPEAQIEIERVVADDPDKITPDEYPEGVGWVLRKAESGAHQLLPPPGFAVRRICDSEPAIGATAC